MQELKEHNELSIYVLFSYKQLYFFSGFNSGPVYHLRVVEQKLSLSFALNLTYSKYVSRIS